MFFFTYKYLRIVLSLLFYLGLNKGTILFANHTYGLSNFIQIYASKLGQAWATGFWWNGALTNFKNFRAWIEQLKIYNYLKYEFCQDSLKGLLPLKRPPSFVFVSGLVTKSAGICNESANLKIGLVALLDTNNMGIGVTFPLAGNCSSLDSLNFFHTLISKSVNIGQIMFLSKFKKILIKNKKWKRLYKKHKFPWWKTRYMFFHILNHIIYYKFKKKKYKNF